MSVFCRIRTFLCYVEGKKLDHCNETRILLTTHERERGVKEKFFVLLPFIQVKVETDIEKGETVNYYHFGKY